MPTNHLPEKPEEPEADMLEVRESETKVSDSEVRDPVPDSEVADAKVLYWVLKRHLKMLDTKKLASVILNGT